MPKQTGKAGPRSELKQLGDRVIASPITIAMTGYEGRPDLEVTFEVVDGQLEPRRVTLVSSDKPVRNRDLRDVHLEALAETVVANWSMAPEVVEGERVVSLLDMPSDEAESRDAVRNLGRVRRRTDTAMLERVALTYLGAEHAPTMAVAEEFDVAHRTAGLYVQRAREAGLLPAAKRGKSDG